jgi:hypothetical protein
MHKKCKLCGAPIILKPSAEARALKYGGVPSDYLKLFDTHTGCALKKHSEKVAELVRRTNHEKLMAMRVTYPKR